MKFNVDDEFNNIFQQIVTEKFTPEQWREVESDDEFQSVHFCSGYDADEDAFCFSYYECRRKRMVVSANLAGSAKGIEVRNKSDRVARG